MKRMTKRCISIILSALLLMTSLPIFAINAFAADKSALESAMAAYEAKMDGNFYTNMKAAYDAYVAAAATDADENATDAQISAAASALDYATGEMGEFSGHVANGPVHYGSTDVDPSAERYAGILWADGTGTTAYDTNQGGKAETNTLGVVYGAYFYFYYPTNTVLMYDGKTTPIMPIMMGVIDKDSNYNLHPCYVGTYSNDFKLFDYWYGYEDNFVWPSAADWLIGYNASTDVGYADAVEIDNTSTVRSFMNYLRYTSTPTDTLTTINGMTFYEQHNMMVIISSIVSHTEEDKVLNMTIPVKIINYKKLLDKLGEVGGLYHNVLDKVSDYKEGGLSDLIDALDEATTDPNSFFTSSNQYQACANWIDKSITDLTNVTVTMDPAAAQSISGAENAMNAFESKISEGPYYKNVLPVYDKYVKLKATVDAYQYGDGTSEAIGEATEALNQAVLGMQTYTKYQATGTVVMSNDTNAATLAKNVIYAPKATATTVVNNGGNQSYNNIWCSVPATAYLLYDGGDIQVPMMMSFHNSSGYIFASSRSMAMYAFYPTNNSGNTDNADYQLPKKWFGRVIHDNMGQSNGANAFTWNQGVDENSTDQTWGGYTTATTQLNDATRSEGQNANNGGDVWAYHNYLKYQPNGSSFVNGLKTTHIGFHYHMGLKSNSNTYASIGEIANTATFYTIDYKTPWDAFTALYATTKANLATGNYDEGGLANAIAALDSFTSVNVGSVNSAATATSVASALSSSASAMNSATSTANGTQYQALRDKISWYPSAEKYVTGMSDPTFWTAESWQALIDAIDAAEAIMTALPSNNAYYYLNPTAAANAATAIQTAYDNLVEAGILIDPAIEAYIELISLLDDYTYLASDLQTAANAVNGLATSYYDAGPIGTKIPATDANRAAIANEVAVFTAAAEALTEQSFDKDAYESYIEAAHRGANDPDAINLTQLNSDIAVLENAALETVHFPHYGDIIGLKANAQTAVDNAWTAVQTDLTSVMQYTVTVVDVDGNAITGVGEGTYAYGTEVTINAGTADYKYDYVSNTGNTDGAHKVKNIGTVDSFTFTVQGNTTITVGAPTDSKPIKVIYRAALEGGNTFVIGTEYVASADDIDVNAVKAPSYAFYSLSTKTKGAVKNNEVTVTLNYTLANGLPQYTIWNDETEKNEYHYFNELVTIDMEDAPAILIAKSQDDYDAWYEQCDEGEFTDRMVEVAAYGSVFTFRAREDLWTIYIDDIESYKDSYKVQYQDDDTNKPSDVYVRSQNTTSGTSLVTYNAIALPEDYEIVEAGLIVQYNKAGDDLLKRDALNFNEVGKDNGNEKVRRLKATKVFDNEDNRYSITLNLASGAKAKYRAYVNYTDGEGAMHTVYGDVNEATIG